MLLRFRHQVSRLVFALLVLAAAIDPRISRAEFKVVSEAAVTAKENSTELNATLTVKGKGGNIIFDTAQNVLLVRGNSQHDLTFTYSPVPAEFDDPSSIADNKGIFATTQFGPWSGSVIGSASATYTHAGERFLYSTVHYKLVKKPNLHWGEFDVTPSIKLAQASLVVQTKASDGTVQPNPQMVGDQYLGDLLPTGKEVADIAFNMYVVTTDKTHRGGFMDSLFVPAVGVEARVAYMYGGQAVITTPWVKTDATGHAISTLGAGRETVPIKGWHRPSKLYMKVRRPKGGYLDKMLVMDKMDTFDGTFDISVTDADGTAMPDGFVECWGGSTPLTGGWQQDLDSKGKASFRIPPSGSGTQTKKLTVALNPIVTMGGYPTQIIEMPTGWTGKSNFYLSTELALDKNAVTYKTTPSKNLILRVTDSPGKTLKEITDKEVKHADAWTPGDRAAGKNKLYHPIKPPKDSTTYYLKAIFKNNEADAEEKEQKTGEKMYPMQITRVPAIERPYQFQFVAISAKSPKVSIGSSVLTSRMSKADITKQMRFVQSIFPVPIIYSLGPDQVAPSWYSDSGRIRYYFSYLQKYCPRNIDLVVGVVAPGDLDSYVDEFANRFRGGGRGTAAGLSDIHYPNVVLIDPSRIPAHGVLHEFLHTRGMADNYGTNDLEGRPASENGYNLDGLIPMINELKWAGYPQHQAIMYDYSNSAWPTRQEYETLLNYATVPIFSGSSVKQTSALQAAGPQKVMIVSARYAWPSAPFTTPPELVEYDPVFTDYDDAYAPQPSAESDYLMAGVRFSNANASIKQDAWVRPLIQQNSPIGTHFDKSDAGVFTFKIPYRDEYTQLTYGCFNWRKELTVSNKLMTYSANAPTATWTGPGAGTTLKGSATLSFKAEDKDYSVLYAWVKVSTDGGQNWRAAAPYYQIQSGANTFTLDCNQYPSTTQCKFRVLISDGLRSTILEPATLYTLEGFSGDPKIAAEPASYVVTVKSPAAFTIPLRITNQGLSPLTVDITTSSLATWMDASISRLSGQVVGYDAEFFPIGCKLTSAGTYTATLKIKTNDPKTPTLNYTVSVTAGSTAQAPQVMFVESDPPSLNGEPIRPAGAVTFNAWEIAGRDGLDARIRIEETQPSSAVLIESGQMRSGPNPGQYVYDWTPPNGSSGKTFAAEVTITDAATGLKDSNGSNASGWDVAFMIANAANRAPGFSSPTTHTLTLSAKVGQQLTLSYKLSDPDGDPLTQRLTFAKEGIPSTTIGALWDQAAGTIRFTPTTANKFTLTLTASDPDGAIIGREWVITAAQIPNTSEHAWPGDADGSVIYYSPFLLYATNTSSVQQKGCRFDWRLQGATSWNVGPLLAWRSAGGGLWDVYGSLDASKLTAGKTYEVRYVNVNPSGKDDPNATVLHFVMASNGAKVTKIDAPSTVAAGGNFLIRIYVLNQSSHTWTKATGYKITSGSTNDPFTGGKFLELGPFDQVAPGGTAVYETWCKAPTTTGSYMTKWQPYTDTLKSYGTAGQKTIQVNTQPTVNPGEVRDYLLGKWLPSSSWLKSADINQDGVVNVADLLKLNEVLSTLDQE